MAELVGLIASIIGIATAISESYKKIKHVKGLPAAFNTVEDNLAIVEQTLQLAKGVLDTHPEQTDKPHVEDTIRSYLEKCKINAESLRDIFEALARDVEAQQPSGNWQQHLKARYMAILLRFKQLNKAHRVEELIQQLLTAVQNLGNYQIFRSATKKQSLLDKIDNAVDKLNDILGEDPSLTEEDLKASSQSQEHANVQNNYGSGQGNQFNPMGGTNTFHTAGVMNNHHGPVTYQTSQPDAKSVGKIRWIVPRPVNTLFIGRVEEIDRIRDALNNKSERPVVVITGDGGMGKSELCLRIAELMRQDFWAVFWVDVSEQKTARAGFADIARAGFGWDEEKPPDYEQSLLALANSKERWLLILDNADDIDFDYSRYIPSGAQGALIITSRNPECSRYSTMRTERLETLDEELATKLLLKAARVPQDLWQSHEKEALEVVGLLGSHTLGLVLAGAYVAAGNCQLGQYSAKFKRQRSKLLKWQQKQGPSTYGSVHATFEVSADFLKKTKNKAGRDALKLLSVLCMLHSSVLWLDLFEFAWRVALKNTSGANATARWLISRLPRLIDIQTQEWDDGRLNEARIRLESLSLVTRHSDGDHIGLSMHPLAHAWAKDRLSPKQQRQAWVTTGCVLTLSTYIGGGRQRFWQGHLRAHTESFLSFEWEPVLSGKQKHGVLAILIRCGKILEATWGYSGLEQFLGDIYKALGICPSDPQVEYFEIWGLAARNMQNTNQTREAVALMQKVVEVHRATLNESHVDWLLSSESLLASAYATDNQFVKAIELYERIIKFQKRTLDENHPNLRNSIINLAIAYRNNKQFKKAIELLLECVQATLDKNSLTRHLLDHELALAYHLDGREKKAVDLMQKVVDFHTTTLPDRHPERLRSERQLREWTAAMNKEPE